MSLSLIFLLLQARRIFSSPLSKTRRIISFFVKPSMSFNSMEFFEINCLTISKNFSFSSDFFFAVFLFPLALLGISKGFSTSIISFSGFSSSLTSVWPFLNSDSGIKKYLHITPFSLLKGIAKSFISLKATLIAGFCSESFRKLFSFNKPKASFSLLFK